MSKTMVPLKLVGEDGNAFSILGRASKALRRAGMSNLFDEYHTEATSGDYNHLLYTTMMWFDVDGESKEEKLPGICECCEDSTDGEYLELCDDCMSNKCSTCREI